MDKENPNSAALLFILHTGTLDLISPGIFHSWQEVLQYYSETR